MISDGEYQNAFQMLCCILLSVGETDIDDDGEIDLLGSRIYRLWQDIIEKAGADDRRRMFEWFMSHSVGNNSYAEDHIERILSESFDEKEFENEKLKFFENMIDRAEKQCTWQETNYDAERWAGRYINVLTDISEERTEDAMKKYRKYFNVREMYIDRCMMKKEYDKAIELLDEGISEDKEYSGLILEYSIKKKEIYLLTGNKEAYLKQLWLLAADHAVGDMELYRELKRQYSEAEWVRQREKLFAELPEYTDKAMYYNEEGMYDRLLECVIESQGLYMTEKYEAVLSREYPQQLLNKYSSELEKMAAHTGTRRIYSDMIAVMRRMRKVIGGKARVAEIAEEWRIKYKNRPAMMDELNKL